MGVADQRHIIAMTDGGPAGSIDAEVGTATRNDEMRHLARMKLLIQRRGEKGVGRALRDDRLTFQRCDGWMNAPATRARNQGTGRLLLVLDIDHGRSAGACLLQEMRDIG